jgi:hypothetical protein
MESGEAEVLHQVVVGQETLPNDTEHPGGAAVMDCGAGLEALLNCTEHPRGPMTMAHSGSSIIQRQNSAF